MARTTISPAKIGFSGFATGTGSVAADATNGMAVAVEYGGAMLIVQNAGGAAITVTMFTNSPLPEDPAEQLSVIEQQANLSRKFQIPAGQYGATKMDNSAEFKQKDGKFYLDFSSATGVTVMVVDGKLG